MKMSTPGILLALPSVLTGNGGRLDRAGRVWVARPEPRFLQGRNVMQGGQVSSKLWKLLPHLEYRPVRSGQGWTRMATQTIRTIMN